MCERARLPAVETRDRFSMTRDCRCHPGSIAGEAGWPLFGLSVDWVHCSLPPLMYLCVSESLDLEEERG